MRRRRRAWPVAEPPAHLRAFDPEAWASVEDWFAARHEWAGVHGWVGGALQVFVEHLAVRQGRPLPAPSYPYWCPPLR